MLTALQAASLSMIIQKATRFGVTITLSDLFNRMCKEEALHFTDYVKYSVECSSEVLCASILLKYIVRVF
jgi:hypothetical protein